MENTGLQTTLNNVNQLANFKNSNSAQGASKISNLINLLMNITA